MGNAWLRARRAKGDQAIHGNADIGLQAKLSRAGCQFSGRRIRVAQALEIKDEHPRRSLLKARRRLLRQFQQQALHPLFFPFVAIEYPQRLQFPSAGIPRLCCGQDHADTHPAPPDASICGIHKPIGGLPANNCRRVWPQLPSLQHRDREVRNI